MPSKKTKVFREQGTYKGVKYDLTAKTRRELNEKVKARIQKIDCGVIDENMTVSAWAHQWLKTYVRPKLSDYEYRQKESRVRRYILQSIGGMKISTVRSAHLQNLLNNLDCPSSTGNKIKQCITQMFRVAVQNQIIMYDPSQGIELLNTRPATRRRSLTAAERELIVAEAYRHRGGLWLMVQLYCGLRPSEAACLQKKDLADKSVLTVDKAIDRHTGQIKAPKSAAGVRQIPIPHVLSDFIRHWAYWDNLQPFDYIITTLDGKLLKDSGQQAVWKSMRREMDIANGAQLYRNAIVQSTLADDLTPYLLRHTYCTDLQAAGVPINVARELMGHADISTTASIYTHHSDDSYSAAIRSINNLYALREKSSEGNREGNQIV